MNEKFLVKAFTYFLWGSLFWVAWLGIVPYAKLVDSLQISGWNGIGLLPFIGGMLLFLLRFVGKLGAVLVYGVVQFLEILPIVIFNSELVLGRIISRGNSSRKVEIQEEDSFAEKAAKRAFNAIPYAVISDCLQWAVIAYVVDFVVNAIALSPVKNGGFLDLFYVLQTQQLDRLDWGNILRILGTMFLLEIIVVLIIQLTRMRNLVKESS